MRKPPQPQLAPCRTLLLATDRSRSILAEATPGTINRVAYSPYGSQRADGLKQTRLGFNGELREPSYGWYHLGNGHRIYNPALRRFHSPDQLSPFAEGGLNPYAYCVGDPINHTDPTGRAPQIVHIVGLAAFGFSIVAGGASLFLPLVLKRAAAAAAAGPRSRFVQAILKKLVKYKDRKPTAATPLGGLEAVSMVLSTASSPVGIVGTVQSMQEDPAAIDNNLVIVGTVFNAFTVLVKGLVVPLTPKLMTSKWGGRFAEFVHGKKKVASAKKEVVGSRLYDELEGGTVLSSTRVRSPSISSGSSPDLPTSPPPIASPRPPLPPNPPLAYRLPGLRETKV